MLPNLAGFIAFIRSNMGINTTVLPDNSIYIEEAYNVAVELVNEQINKCSNTLYTRAVYNLAADNLLNYAQDQSGQTFFSDVRTGYGINSFVAGVIQSSADESTSESMLVPDFFKHLTLSNLQNLKTPYGRAYLQIAQSMGPNWGLT
jgi:hypothetical protein